MALNRFAGWLGRFKDQNRTSKAGKNYMVVQGCGYNAAKFDHPFLLTECRRHGIFMPMDMRCWDTMQFAMFMFQAKGIVPVDYKLSTIAETLGIELVNAHDALADVIATAEITKKLFSMV
jgi:DNA polymerase III epsilon subunit-like protein